MPHSEVIGQNFRRSRFTFTLGVVASLALLIATPITALAHSDLASSSPKDGAEVTKPPSQIVLTFAEEVLPQGSGIVVNGPDGNRYDEPDTLDVGGTEASIDLKTSTADGRYDVTYRIVSADGHVVAGSTTYTVKSAAPSNSPTSTTSSAPSDSAETLDAEPAVNQGEPDDEGTSVVWVLGLGAIGIVLVMALVAVFVRGRRG